MCVLGTVSFWVKGIMTSKLGYTKTMFAFIYVTDYRLYNRWPSSKDNLLW